MEPAHLIDPNALQRDWIEGTTGKALYRRVQCCMTQIEAAGEDARVRGVLLVEADPLRFAAAFFAAVSLGVPVILANPKWQHVEWERVATLVNPAVIFGEAAVSTAARTGIQHPQPGSILIPTGGSTAGVKFAAHTWQTLLAACNGLSELLGEGPIHSCCVLPLFHVSGLMQLVRSFVTAGHIIFTDFKALQAGQLPDFSPGALCLSLVPTQLQRIMAQQNSVDWLRTLRVIVVGGSATPSSVIEQARALQLPVMLSYGMTETAAMVTALPAAEFLAGQTNAGRALSHACIQVLREDGAECRAGESGQIRIRATSMFKGYHGRSGEVSKLGYLSDDEGYFDSLGCLHVVGRSDRLIVSGGEKIDPHEVEQAILHSGQVEQVMVVGWPDSEWGQKLVALYVPRLQLSGKRDWEAELRANLANYKIPKQILQVAALPLNERGKVDRQLIQRLIE